MSEAKTCWMTTPEYLRWCAAQGEVLTIDEMERAAKKFDALVAACEGMLAAIDGSHAQVMHAAHVMRAAVAAAKAGGD